MKKTIFTILSLALIAAVPVSAQVQTARVGVTVPQVEVRDSNDNPVKLPFFGEKHILVFYPDPDNYKQNEHFTDYLEEHPINSGNIHSFGVTNMKDAPMYPNGIIRSMIRKKEKKTGATIYTDPAHLLRDGWGLGECNNQFVIIFVTKDRKIEYLKKGAMSEQDTEEFFRVIDKYK